MKPRATRVVASTITLSVLQRERFEQELAELNIATGVRCETVERVGLKQFLDGVGLEASIDMITQPRNNPYYKSENKS